MANVREHATLKERPVDRFERERGHLRPVATRPYRSLVLSSRAKPKTRTKGVPHVGVERRGLEVYARIAGGVR